MPAIQRGHGKRQKSRNFFASKWTKKLESLTKIQPKIQPQISLKQTFVLTPSHFKIVSIPTKTGCEPPYDNKVGVCAYMKYHSVIRTSEKVPQPGAQELMHVPDFPFKPSTEVARIFGDAQEKDMALRQQLDLEGFWCLLLQCNLM